MGGPAVVVSVEKQPNVDTVTLTRTIEEALSELNASLPFKIKADQILFRQANFIEASIHNVQRVLIEAALVVAVVLFAFLLNWRTTAISLTAIPVSILATAVIFKFAGLSINTMTLGGLAIAIGELVDDAVVDVENIFRRLRENRSASNPRPVFDVVVSASQEVRSGIVYATMIIVLVFVPLFALSGIEGRLFAPLGQAYIISILASLVVSITLTPVMAYYMLPGLKRLAEHESWLVRVLKRGYRRPARARIPARRRTHHGDGAGGADRRHCCISSCPAHFSRRSTKAPSPSTSCSIPAYRLPNPTGLAAIAERLILEVPDVKTVGRRTGRAELDEHAEGVHSSEIDVDLKPSSRPKTEILADIRARLAVLPLSDQYRAADIAPPRSHAVRRAGRDRPENLWR